MLQSICKIKYHFYISRDFMISYAIFISYEKYTHSSLNSSKTITEMLSIINQLIKQINDLDFNFDILIF